MFFPEFDEFEPVHPLVLAVKEKRYGTLYALLKKQTKPLPFDLACELAYSGIDCSIRAFRAILDRCPLDKILDRSSDPRFHFQYEYNYRFSLLDTAALHDQPDHLEELLRRGADPNGDPRYPGSTALLAAFLRGASRSVKRLIREPALDRRLTDELLSLWAQLGMKDAPEGLAACCLAAAPRLLEEPLPPPLPSVPLFQGIPLPRQLTAVHAAKQENWPLAEYLCRRNSLTPKEGMKLANCLRSPVNDLHLLRGSNSLRWKPRKDLFTRKQLVSLLDALFSACPQLLRRRLPQTLLVFAALTGKAVPKALRPWLDRLPGRKLVLSPELEPQVLAGILPLWQPRFGSRWIPVLDPQSIWPSYFFTPFRYLDGPMAQSAFMAPELDILLSHCQLRSFPPGKELTGLSRSLLGIGSPAQIIRQLQSGGLLRMEDPHVLLKYCFGETAQGARFFSPFSVPVSPQRRQIVLTHIDHVKADYTL